MVCHAWQSAAASCTSMNRWKTWTESAVKTCGVIPGKCFRTPKLTRFGYITLTAGQSVFGQEAEEIGEIPAHEFHYFDSENCGNDFHAAKPLSKRGWDCIHSTGQSCWQDIRIYIIMEIRKFLRLFC